MSRVKAGVLFVKETKDFRIVGTRDGDGNVGAECSCGHSILGCQDYWAMRSWISSHAARHTLKAVSR
jgi:acetone carboxylase gamma subunit